MRRLILFILILNSFQYGNAQDIIYTDRAAENGIDHTYVINNSGGGVSFEDFNGDGLDDLTLATGIGEEIHFYRNTGTTFEKLSLNISDTSQVKTVLWADFDNDGDKDLYFTCFLGTNRLYENLGNLEMEDITEESGLPMKGYKCFGAIWGDYNRDGWLDLYYTERPADTTTVQRNRLFKNNADGTFTETSTDVNAGDEGRLPFCAAFFDFNNDKWPDIYIANDRKKRNTLLENNQGVFSDVSEECNAAIEMDAMNVAIADIEYDGYQDIYVTNIPDGSALLTCSYENDAYVFDEEAESRGVGFYGVGWGANFLDANNNGWQDLYVNGMIAGSDAISSALYINDGTGHFSGQIPAFEADTVRSFTNATGDWNQDGYADIMCNNSEGFNSQLWTAPGGSNNYIKIKLEGVLSNRDGVGSRIELYYNGFYQNHFTHSGIAFMGQNSSTLLYGLADNSVVDSIKVTWPTGHVDTFIGLEANTMHLLVEGATSNNEISVDPDVELVVRTNTQTTATDVVRLYPNPASEYINIDGLNPSISYTIFDINGRLVEQGIGNFVDTEMFIEGIYIIKIKSGINIYTKKFVIQK